MQAVCWHWSQYRIRSLCQAPAAVIYDWEITGHFISCPQSSYGLGFTNWMVTNIKWFTMIFKGQEWHAWNSFKWPAQWWMLSSKSGRFFCKGDTPPPCQSCRKAQGTERDVLLWILLNTGIEWGLSRKVLKSAVHSSQEKEQRQKKKYTGWEPFRSKYLSLVAWTDHIGVKNVQTEHTNNRGLLVCGLVSLKLLIFATNS